MQVEEQHDDAGRGSSDWQVDVEIPSPRDVLGESTSQERTNDTGERKRRADRALPDGTFMQRDDGCEDNQPSSEYP